LPGINRFNVGLDLTVSVVWNGQTLTINGKKIAEFRPIYVERTHHDLDGLNYYLPIPAGWEGTIELDRRDSNVDTFYAAQEDSYYSGNGLLPGTITETVNNALDGSVSVFLYDGVMFHLAEGGRWSGDDIVVQRIGWRCTRRIQLQ
jgi:hypothetical protein